VQTTRTDYIFVRFEVFKAVTMKNGVFWDVSGYLSASIIRVTKIGELGTLVVFLRSVRRLLVTANVVPSSPILVTLMMEALISS
jgi:hypothetical protein